MTFLDELIGFVELGEADRTCLAALLPRLEPHFPAIADRFYAAVHANPSTAALLSSPEQVERLRRTLVDWMASGLRGPYDEAFHAKRSRIGRRHVQIGLAAHYMFTAMNVVRLAYQDLVLALVPAAEQAATLRAVHKLLDIELAIMQQHYQLDFDERLIARERRVQADRILAIQTMSAGLAHEVRNPLNAAKLQLELLERRLNKRELDSKLIEPTQLAQSEIERLTALLNDFLAFARPPELHPQESDVGQILRQVVDLERLAADRRGAELHLVAPDGPVLAQIDPPKLHQLVLNLVRNAIEAVPQGGHVAVELAVGDGVYQIRVADDGPGIPDQVRPRIYEPFFSTKEGGTGLGMSIVHSLVSLHGGRIDLATSARGTTFEVTIPSRQ